MASSNALAALITCLVSLVASKENIVVRRASVDASGEVQHDRSRDPFSNGRISMSVDADGKLMQLGDREEVGIHDPTEMARMLRTSGGKIDEKLISIRQHDDTNASQAPACGRPRAKANRFELCRVGECDQPRAFMIALAQDEDGTHRTMLESFSSEGDVDFDGYWPGTVSRTELNANMIPTDDRAVCQGHDTWSDWAMLELATPTQCKMPSSKWRLVESVMNPTVEKTLVVKFKVGRVLEVQNDLMESLIDGQHKLRLTKEAFTEDTCPFRGVAQTENDNVWEAHHIVAHDIAIERGKNTVIYQYVLTCKLFNEVNMHVNELQFRLPHFTIKDELSIPNCQPAPEGGFQVCHTLASETGINDDRAKTGQDDPTYADVSPGQSSINS